MRALVTVENLRGAVLAQGVLQCVYTERGIHGVAQSPTEHLAAVPVDNGNVLIDTLGETGNLTLVPVIDIFDWIRRYTLNG